jgi:medium-chain acyl-[acyl-carrier-protein] hydrolase
MDSFQFEKEYRIPVYDIGPDGKLSLSSIFNYMQDVASEHAIRLNFGRDDLLKQNHFWVLSRILADFKCWPVWEDNIIVRTWPRGTEKLFAIRDYEIFYKDGRQIATGTSSWLIVDITTKRIQRPDAILTRFNSVNAIRSSMVRNAGKVELPDVNANSGESFKIRISDLDINLHTNNVRYIKWVADTYDLDYVLHHEPVSVEVNYLSESVLGEDVFIRSYEKVTGSSFVHSIIRPADNKEISRMTIDWRNCSH